MHQRFCLCTQEATEAGALAISWSKKAHDAAQKVSHYMSPSALYKYSRYRLSKTFLAAVVCYAFLPCYDVLCHAMLRPVLHYIHSMLYHVAPCYAVCCTVPYGSLVCFLTQSIVLQWFHPALSLEHLSRLCMQLSTDCSSQCCCTSVTL